MLGEAEEEMCEPAWTQPLELIGVSWGKPAAARAIEPLEIDPATVVPSTRAGQISRFLPLRLAIGTASKKDLDKASVLL